VNEEMETGGNCVVADCDLGWIFFDSRYLLLVLFCYFFVSGAMQSTKLAFQYVLKHFCCMVLIITCVNN